MLLLIMILHPNLNIWILICILSSRHLFNLLLVVNAPHRTVLEVFPHTALQEHILNTRIEYKSSDISLAVAMDYTSQTSGIVASCSSSSDCACLSIYGQVLKLVHNMPALMTYYRLFHNSGNVLSVSVLAPATIPSVL